MTEPIDATGVRGEHDLERFLSGVRSRGERTIGLVRIGLLAAGIAFALSWSLLNRDSRSPFLPSMLVVLFAHLAAAVLYLLFIPRWKGLRSPGYYSAAFDLILSATTFILFLGGERSGLRLSVVKDVVPLLYVTFVLISLGRHDPANTLFTGVLGVAFYATIRVVTGTVVVGELVEELFRVAVLVAATAVGWFSSREVLRLTLKVAAAEQALHLEQVYLLNLFESTPEAVVLLTPSSRVMRANSAFLRLFGYTHEELAGTNVDELIMPEHREEETQALTETTGRGQGLGVETVRRRKDGGPVDVSILGAPIYLDGAQVATFGIYRDIHERRRRERLLEALNRASLGLLRASTEDEAFGAAAAELGGIGVSTALLAYDQEAGTLALTHVRGVGELWSRLEALIDRPLLGQEARFDPGNPLARPLVTREPLYRVDKSEMARWLAEQNPGNAEADFLAILAPYPSITVPLLRGGKVVGLLVALAPDLVAADVPALSAFAHQLAASLAQVGLIGELGRNLEELRRTEVELLHAQKLEAVGRLARGVAHDFNNLLTIINGYAEVLIEELPRDDTKGQAALEILRAGRKAAELTGRLVAFSRRQHLKLEVLDLNAVVEGMRNALERLIGEEVRLEVSLASSLPKVRMDPGQTSQMILNMSLNARDALRGGGLITIRTSCRTPDATLLAAHPGLGARPYVCLELEDTGGGISPEVLPHLFEPFFSTKESGKGTGLGLAMVYGFVKQSGGCVWAENRAGGGARFTVYLPASSAPQVEEAPGGL